MQRRDYPETKNNAEASFSYTYCAQNNQEVLRIRNKYLPQNESPTEELIRLDQAVQNAGNAPALCLGISGCLLLGLGMCLSMQVIGNAVWLGIPMGLLGMAAMLCAFPVYKKYCQKAKEKHLPRILELLDQLSGNQENL